MGAGGTLLSMVGPPSSAFSSRAGFGATGFGVGRGLGVAGAEGRDATTGALTLLDTVGTASSRTGLGATGFGVGRGFGAREFGMACGVVARTGGE